MARLNDAADNWRSLEWADGSACEEAMKNHAFAMGMNAAAGDLDTLAREAWHPVSEPPTEADGDGCGMVAVAGVNGRVTVEKWQAVHPYLLNQAACKWGRISDVLLLPEGEGE